MSAPAKPAPRPTPQSQRYWAACAEGRLEIQRCSSCGAAIFFPRRRCPQCGSDALAPEVADGRGTVYSFSVVHQAPIESYRADTPYVLALIELREGPRIMANVVGCDPAAVRVGTPVRVVFEARGEGISVPQFEINEERTA